MTQNPLTPPKDQDDEQVIKDLLRHNTEAGKRSAILEWHKSQLDYDEIFAWLLGKAGDFPVSEPGKRYSWRVELRERIAKLTETNFGDPTQIDKDK